MESADASALSKKMSTDPREHPGHHPVAAFGGEAEGLVGREAQPAFEIVAQAGSGAMEADLHRFE
jgi:hypothetical protein